MSERNRVKSVGLRQNRNACLPVPLEIGNVSEINHHP